MLTRVFDILVKILFHLTKIIIVLIISHRLGNVINCAREREIMNNFTKLSFINGN